MKASDKIKQMREDIERMGGSIGSLTPMANWVELHGVFTPMQLRQLATNIEKQYTKQ